MKKLMIVAAIVCAAAFTQAASVNWGGAAAYGEDYADFAAGQTAYLIYTGTSQAALAALITMDGDDYTKWTVDNGGSVVASYTLTEENVNPEVAAFTATYSNADAAGGVNGYYQVVIADPEMTKFTANDIGQVVGASDQSGAFDARVNFDWAGDDCLGIGGYTGTIETVPEPTTGLLMLLGMGALALRRRRA